MVARAVVVSAILLSLTLAGCVGTPQDAPDDSDADEAHGSLNMWQTGLSNHYETPDVALTRSSDDRRADVAPPGDPEYAQFDQVMLSIMERYDVPAGSLALMHDGRLLYASGYGYTKPDATGMTDTDTMFRMASVTKPITHALVSLQVEQGLYAWDDPVFCLPPDPDADCLLPLTPHPAWPVVDERIADITVRMLVEHTGGWDRSGDHLYRLEGILEMQELFGIEGMPHRWHVATYLMGTSLVHDPGTHLTRVTGQSFTYCNMCYLLASLVAEAAAGADLQALFDAYLFRPLGVEGDIELGKMPIEERNLREPFYISGGEAKNVYNPNETVNRADGAYSIEIIAAGGGLIGTPEAVAAVYEAYPAGIPPRDLLDFIDPYDAAYDNRHHSGLIDGTSAVSLWADDIQTDSGVIQYVALFNAAYPYSQCEGVDGVASNAVCPGWVQLRNELFLLMAEKAREG